MLIGLVLGGLYYGLWHYFTNARITVPIFGYILVVIIGFVLGTFYGAIVGAKREVARQRNEENAALS
jgi:tetrahydromethanopterin S-methyltransferase subunit C